MTIQELTKTCSKVFNMVGLNFEDYNIEVGINGRLTKTLGRCMYIKRVDEIKPYRIEFSKQFLETSTPTCILDVIKHECAHAIATIKTGEKHGHDAYFKSVCAKVGTTNDGVTTDAERTVADDKIFKYFVICENCGKVCGKYHKAGKVIQHPEFYTCECGGKINVKKNW